MSDSHNQDKIDPPSAQPADSAPAQKPGSFPQTRWSLIVSTREEGTPEAEKALAELCEMYWFPLYAYIRGRGYAPPDAEDLTQGFFAKIVEKNYLGSADANRGKLRSYLLGAMKHFLSDQRDLARAQKRGGNRVLLSLDQKDAEDRYLVEPSHDENPEVLFEKQWARTLLNHILDRLRSVYADLGKEEVFEHLHPFLAWNSKESNYQEAAPKLGMTEKTAQVAVFRMRKRFGELLRAQIAETVSSPDEVPAELNHISNILRA